MSTVEVGKKVPDFELPATSDLAFRLADFKGKKVVIYFYPKDNTPGCTTEGQDFRDLSPEFAGENAVIFGVSRTGCAPTRTSRRNSASPSSCCRTARKPPASCSTSCTRKSCTACG